MQKWTCTLAKKTNIKVHSLATSPCGPYIVWTQLILNMKVGMDIGVDKKLEETSRIEIEWTNHSRNIRVWIQILLRYYVEK